MDYRVQWRKRDGMATSQGESALTLALTGFYWLNLHRNTGHILKAHQSLSGSNNQIVPFKILHLKNIIFLYQKIKLAHFAFALIK